MTKSELIGYLRKSNNGNALKMSISADAFEKAAKYTGKDEKEYVSLIINLEKAREVMEGQREVTSVSQLLDE
jgi:heme-binding NEAT domain protein